MSESSVIIVASPNAKCFICLKDQHNFVAEQCCDNSLNRIMKSLTVIPNGDEDVMIEKPSSRETDNASSGSNPADVENNINQQFNQIEKNS